MGGVSNMLSAEQLTDFRVERRPHRHGGKPGKGFRALPSTGSYCEKNLYDQNIGEPPVTVLALWWALGGVFVGGLRSGTSRRHAGRRQGLTCACRTGQLVIHYVFHRMIETFRSGAARDSVCQGRRPDVDS